MSSRYVPDGTVRQLFLKIDSTAYTPLTAFRDMRDLEFLKYDVTNLVHYVKHDAATLVIGAGGGRDILSALAFEQHSVTAVEINGNIISAVNERFGDFSQHLDRNPNVTFINDEARSYVARQRDTFDIIQVSLIDTWAATAAGAFVLSETSLYTVEAWTSFLEHLRPDGILTVSRWYFKDNPGEVYRLTALATASLAQLGVEKPRDHIVVVRNMQPNGASGPDGVGTILVRREPFQERDIRMLEDVSQRMGFEVVLSPRFALNANFGALTSPADLPSFTASFPLNIAPPTDDSPFFFHMLRLKDIFKKDLWAQGYMTHNMKAVFVLGSLLIVVTVLTLLFIMGPLILTTDRTALKGAAPAVVFFGCIGFGFMLVEISQMQRLIVFLGHPTYGLSVVLFTLLVASGIGSYTTRHAETHERSSTTLRLLLLILALVVFGVLTPSAMFTFQSSTTAVRIVVAVAILFPLGVFMGMAFPLGMKMAATTWPTLTPWFWGINGTTSVMASVLAVVIAMTFGISSSFWAGVACYVAAVLAYLFASLAKEAVHVSHGDRMKQLGGLQAAYSMKHLIRAPEFRIRQAGSASAFVTPPSIPMPPLETILTIALYIGAGWIALLALQYWRNWRESRQRDALWTAVIHAMAATVSVAYLVWWPILPALMWQAGRLYRYRSSGH